MLGYELLGGLAGVYSLGAGHVGLGRPLGDVDVIWLALPRARARDRIGQLVGNLGVMDDAALHEPLPDAPLPEDIPARDRAESPALIGRNVGSGGLRHRQL